MLAQVLVGRGSPAAHAASERAVRRLARLGVAKQLGRLRDGEAG